MSRNGNKTAWGIAAVLMAFAGAVAGGTYGGGLGTPQDPYQIWDANHMQTIGAESNDWAMHFMLMADIDLSGVTYSRALIGHDKDHSFTGSFDGNGHIVSNLTVEGENYVGLFGYIGDGGSVCDLGLKEANITGHNHVGGLVGCNNGSVTTCCSTGTVSGIERKVGGLVGENWRGSVSDCYTTADVNGVFEVGGLVGDAG